MPIDLEAAYFNDNIKPRASALGFMFVSSVEYRKGSDISDY